MAGSGGGLKTASADTHIRIGALFPNAALQHDHSQRHGGADKEPPEKNFQGRPHRESSKLHPTAETAVLNRFRHMRWLNLIRAREIGYGSRHTYYAPMGSSRQSEFGQCLV